MLKVEKKLKIELSLEINKNLKATLIKSKEMQSNNKIKYFYY